MSEVKSVPLQMRRTPIEPTPELARLRTEAPVSLIETSVGAVRFPAWLLTRYEDVRAVLSDAVQFSNSVRAVRAHIAAAVGEEAAARLPVLADNSLIGSDPPDHTRLRRMLAPKFTAKRMFRLRPRIEAIVSEHLDAMAEQGGPVDLVQAFAIPVPSLVICELLGVPYADRAGFQRRSKAMMNYELDLESRRTVFRESHAFMAELVRRHRADPGDDLLGSLAREHGDELSDEELTDLGDLMLLAGHETTANMLGLGTLVLLRHPDQLALLRDDPTISDRAVDELMRYLTIAHSGAIRTATRDVTIGGTPIRAGEAVICSLPAANRDPAVTADPDVLDLTREPTPHVGFGHGVHHCLGASLARLEMQIAFPALLSRFPALRLAVPFEELSFHGVAVMHGVEALPVTW